MILTDEQCDRFFDTMESLLGYVNLRFRVVKGLSFEGETALDDARISLVAQTLWNNVSVIDDFARENPDKLSPAHVQTALSWKDALMDYFTLVRYQGNGRAVLMSEAGVFAVGGLFEEVFDTVGEAPALIDATLLPFDGMIVHDGMVLAYDIEDAAHAEKAIQDEFEERCREGIVSTEDEFVARSRAYHAHMHEQELDDFIAGLERTAARNAQGESLPDGFHRGALAGLADEERAKAVDGRLHEVVRDPRVAVHALADAAIMHGKPASSLAECLMSLPREDLATIAQQLEVPHARSLPKYKLAPKVAEEVCAHPDALAASLTVASPELFETLRSLKQGVTPCSLEELATNDALRALPPFIWLMEWQGEHYFVVPDEVRALLADMDLDAIEEANRQEKQALAFVMACCAYRGVQRFIDLYDEYRSVAAAPLARDDFENLVRFEAGTGNLGFGLMAGPTGGADEDIVVHHTLTRDYSAMRVVEESKPSVRGPLVNKELDIVEPPEFLSLTGSMREDLEREFTRDDQVISSILAGHEEYPAKPVTREMLEEEPFELLKRDPAAQALRTFIDGHIPDGRDDHLFADFLMREVIASAVEVNDLGDLTDLMDEAGMTDASDDPEILPMLLTNVLDAMPAWECNGYSSKELYERMTGRKTFYDAEGRIMRVGSDDPCPCGSGRKYRDCCGN